MGLGPGFRVTEYWGYRVLRFGVSGGLILGFRDFFWLRV